MTDRADEQTPQDPKTLPLGLQLIGRPFDEETLFAAAQVIEDAAGRTKLPAAWWA